MDYLQWNDSIAKHFFNPENAGKEVLLYVNKDLIEELGQPYGCGQPDFINAVKTGPRWTTRTGFCQKALQTCLNWRTKGTEYPPYIAYLACFVLAAGTQMDVRSSAYYPRLNKILDEPEDNTIPSFSRVSVLWEDLEKWSKEDKHEELGRFVFGIQGKMIWVGLPRFQTLISAEERKDLSGLFLLAELDPSDPPTPEVMLKLMIFHGDHIFQRRTREVLSIDSDENIVLRSKLLEFFLEELEDWDGSVSEQIIGTSKSSFSIQSGLRLCITEIDTIAHRVDVFMRLKTNRQYPEEALRFSSLDIDGILICKEASQGWSKILRDETKGRFNVESINWCNGIQLEDKVCKWKARMKASTVRLFISGKNEGFSGWIETQRLERGIPFKIAAYGADISKVKSWGDTSCDEFNKLKMSGMPEGWILFEGKNAKSSCAEIDVLTLSTSVRLSLRGGVKVRGGNTYLHIAPPLIALENGPGQESITVNGKSLIRASEESHFWNLPEDVEVNEILRIEANILDKQLMKVIRLEEPRLAEDYHAPRRDIFGSIISGQDQEGATFSGAVAKTRDAVSVTDLEFIRPSSRRSIYFLGTPGQVCEWPAEGMPEWIPEWAVEKIGRKEWAVTYCRKSLEDETSGSERIADRQKVKKWKELVWVQRRTTKQPSIPLVRKRWKKYIEAVKNV